MNAFYEHHKDSISFHYACFDRMLLNAAIQPFQQPERVMGLDRVVAIIKAREPAPVVPSGDN